MKCNVCGSEILDNVKFCSNCGNKIIIVEENDYGKTTILRSNSYEDTNKAKIGELKPPKDFETDYVTFKNNHKDDIKNAKTQILGELPFQESAFVFEKKPRRYTFGEAVKSLFANAFNFSGRAVLSEYWYGFLFLLLANLILSYIPFGVIIVLLLTIPNLSLNIRRLHDIGKSGWFMLIGLIPWVGIFILLYFYTRPSDQDNKWGNIPQ